MAAKYYTSLDEEVLDEAQTAAEMLLDFFYRQHSRFGIDHRAANRCTSSVREVADLLNRVQVVSEPVEHTRRVQYAWQ